MTNGIMTDKSPEIIDFNAVRVSLASPEKIRQWSHGEVTKPETINYRTFKPEKDGLFCAKIFGPVNDWECLCGKYKRMKYKGIICDKCGVEVTRSRVRRERMGHIELASPVAHIWFFKGTPSRMCYILDLSVRALEGVLYYERYLVVDPGDTALKPLQILTEEEYREALSEYGDNFEAGMGAEAVQAVLQQIDLDDLAEDLRIEMTTTKSKQKRLKTAKRLKIVDAFRNSGQRPEWMILSVIPVLPPDLRPLVPLDGGRFATSDLNDLYRRVINRNNRLKKLLDLRAPEVIVRNEKRMLQEAVDALFDNGRRGRAVKGSNNRPLKSLSDNLKGKQGRFRQNLLGKRVDYSGRSVIVVGPDLKLSQCGLPKIMALELFKPFIYAKLQSMGVANTIKATKELVEKQEDVVWDALEAVTREHPILLNRAPTLHRLGIQAFEPLLVEGKALQIHPLVCPAFNADFDGDQMAVHVPISPKAQLEARLLMFAPHNVLSPANGRPLAVPTQDMVLGLYYLTMSREGMPGENKIFGTKEEVIHAYEAEVVHLHTPIQYRYTGSLMDLTTQLNDQMVTQASVIQVENYLLETSVGRVIFNDHLPQELPFINGIIKKKGVQELVRYCYLNYGHENSVELLDVLKELGFKYATRGGISFGLEDMVVPDKKDSLIKDTYNRIKDIEKLRAVGSITAGERHNKIIDEWHAVTERVAKEMFSKMVTVAKETNEINPIMVMVDSGARGSKEQVRQLAGMRGLMSKPSGEVMETPITANFREGLSVLQYFISTHGARKGLADTALKTADSGYLTRRLVDVSQDTMVLEYDCGTLDGIYARAIIEAGEILESLADRIVGRVSQQDVLDPLTGDVIVSTNDLIDETAASTIQEAGIEEVKIRSVLTCESRHGVCQLCYGRDLSTGKIVDLGTAVGIIAAQSIGEPGTQLTMRTFHYGGTAAGAKEQTQREARYPGTVKFENVQKVTNKDGDYVVVNRNGIIVILDENKREKDRSPVSYGSILKVMEGSKVEPGQLLLEWDPYSSVILTEIAGTVEFKDIVEGENVKEEVDKVTGKASKIVVETLTPEKRLPHIVVQADKESRKYLLPVHSHLMVEGGQAVQPGDVLVKIPRESTKTKDITGGLPRVQELFEARRPRDPAVVSEIDGVVLYGSIQRGMREIIVQGEFEERKYLIPRSSHVTVQNGEFIKAGEPLNEGPINPHDILAIKGEKNLQFHLVNKIQEVYRSQGVDINDKHVEVIVRQMMRLVRVVEVGDTRFVVDEYVDRFEFQEENDRVLAMAGEPARATPLLLGITKAALATDSWISAASFQETTRVLTAAVIGGQVDYLRGLKENVVVGRTIPVGTGYPFYHRYALEPAQILEREEPRPSILEEAEKVVRARLEMIRGLEGSEEGEDS